MPKIGCYCGNVISLSEIPCPHGFLLRSENDQDRIIEEIVRLHEHADDIKDFEMSVNWAITPLNSPAPHVYQCDACGRLAIMHHPSSDQKLLWFVPEEPENPPRLLASLYDVKMPDRQGKKVNPLLLVLSKVNARAMFKVPEGAIEVQIGGLGDGANVVFRARDGSEILRRVAKRITDYDSFKSELSEVVNNQLSKGGELWIELKEATYFQNWLSTFRAQSGHDLDKYKDISLHVVDRTGQVIYSGPVKP